MDELKAGDRIIADSHNGQYTFEGVVLRDCEDLEAYIFIREDDTGDEIRLCGWNFYIELA